MSDTQKFCPSCGSPNELDGVFCTNCGNKFTEVSAAAIPAAPAAATSAAPAAAMSAASMPPLPQVTRSDFITLSCPNCGGRLQITPDVERFACQFCGYEHIVRRSGGIVSLEPVMKMMGQLNNTIGYVGTGMNRLGFNTEKQAAEVTIKRLKEEISELETNLANFRQGSDNVLVFGGIFLSIAGAAILCGFMGLFSVGIGFLVAAVCVPIGIIIMSSSKNSGAKQKAALQQQITEKEAELQRNYEFVNRFQ